MDFVTMLKGAADVGIIGTIALFLVYSLHKQNREDRAMFREELREVRLELTAQTVLLSRLLDRTGYPPDWEDSLTIKTHRPVKGEHNEQSDSVGE